DSQLDKLERDATSLSETLLQRVREAPLPRDVFTTKLQAPLADLVQAVGQTAEAVGEARDGVKASGVSLSRAVKTLDTKLSNAEPLFDQLADLAEEHEALLAGSKGQLEASRRVAETASI